MGLPDQLASLIPPVLPQTGVGGYCFTTWQRLAVDLFTRAGVQLNTDVGVSFWNTGPATPSPDNRPFPWINSVDGLVYLYSNQYGGWISPIDFPAGGGSAIQGARILWTGPVDGSGTGLWKFWGGDGTDPGVSAPTPISGAVWQVDPAFAALFPLGVGTLPDGTVVTVAHNGGHQDVTIGLTNMPAHEHFIAEAFASHGALTPTNQLAVARDDGEYNLAGDPRAATVGLTSTTGGDPLNANATVPVQVTPPFRGVYFICRTSRAFYFVPG